MKSLLEGIEEILLMGPGPSCVPPEVYTALSRKTLGHLDPYFLEIAEELKEMLRRIMNTKNNLTIPISGTGSAGMEAAFVNLIEPGDRVLILLNGVFGMRMQDVAGRLGAKVDILEFPWGTPVDLEAAEKKIRQESYKIAGLAPISFSDKAMAKVNGRKTKVPNWYLDLTLIANYWGQNRVYHHTAPVNMLYGLYQALLLIFEEGPDKVFQRHRESHLTLVNGLKELGLTMLVEEPYRLPMLNAVCVPDGVNELPVRQRLRSEFKIEIGGGLGPLAGKIWRIGLMGHTAKEENVDRLLLALRKSLRSG